MKLDILNEIEGIVKIQSDISFIKKVYPWVSINLLHACKNGNYNSINSQNEEMVNHENHLYRNKK